MIYTNDILLTNAIIAIVGAIPAGEGFCTTKDGIDNWNMVAVRPTDAAIEFEYNRLLAIYNTQQYARDRETAYNERGSTIQNLSVAIVESMDGTDPQKLIDLQVIRAQVKEDFPKPQ